MCSVGMLTQCHILWTISRSYKHNIYNVLPAIHHLQFRTVMGSVVGEHATQTHGLPARVAIYFHQFVFVQRTLIENLGCFICFIWFHCVPGCGHVPLLKVCI